MSKVKINNSIDIEDLIGPDGIDYQPVGEPVSNNAYTSYGDRSFKVTIYGSKYRGVINTYLAIIGSIISTFCTSPLFNQGKFKIDDILNSCFSGGIVIGGCCHLIEHYWLSLIIGFLCGGVTCCLYNLLSERLQLKGYHDTANIFFYHAIPGFLGGIMNTIFVGNLSNLLSSTDKKIVYK